MSTLIAITIRTSDVHEMCADNDIPENEWGFAVQRVLDWAKTIETTASSLVNEQVQNVVLVNQP